MYYRIFRNAVAVLAFGMSPLATQGDVTVNWEQTGSDVLVSYSGAIPSTNIRERQTTTYNDVTFSNEYFAVWLENQEIALMDGSGIELPFTGTTSASSAGGSTFGFNSDILYWEESAGAAISGWMLIESTTLTALNADNFNNLKVFESDGGDFDVYFHTIPEPSSVVMIGAGLLGAACWLRRRSVA